MKRKLWFDIVRVIAIFLVIVNHTNSQIFQSASKSVIAMISLAYFYFSKIAVGLFIMLSGALLARKSESFRSIFKKIVKYLLIIVFFSYLMTALQPNYTSSMFKSDFIPNISKLYTAQLLTSYWYLYMYLALLLSLPILRVMAKAMSDSDYVYFIGLGLLFSFLTTFVPALTGLSPNPFSIPLIFSALPLYFFLGEFIANRMETKSSYLWIALVTLVISVVINTAVTWHLNPGESIARVNFDGYASFFTILGAISTFYIVRHLFEQWALKGTVLQKMLVSLSGASFGIYLTHSFFVSRLIGVYSKLISYVGRMPAMFIYECVVLISSWIVVVFVKWIFVLLKGLIIKPVSD